MTLDDDLDELAAHLRDAGDLVCTDTECVWRWADSSPCPLCSAWLCDDCLRRHELVAGVCPKAQEGERHGAD